MQFVIEGFGDVAAPKSVSVTEEGPAVRLMASVTATSAI